MFDIGWDEMALIAVVALIVIGPKDLPVVLRQMGRWTRKARELAGEFQRGVDDMMRESELAELKGKVEKATDPNMLRREIEKTIDPTGDIARSLEPPVLPALDEVKLAAEAPKAEEAVKEEAGAPAPAKPELPIELPVSAPFQAPPKPPEP
ncbi:MAG TPA: Sec-independent protein translocase protein TatB [Magnetospirillum sp.]|jgi:sec-independent protein translocase protein TatB|nr:Sec-independent protein translocase protein TatB [Magnetospirillum sp.]